MCALVRNDPFSCHSEAVTDVTAVGIFAFDELPRSTTPEIATPACALVRNDEKGGVGAALVRNDEKGGQVRHWFTMTKGELGAALVRNDEKGRKKSAPEEATLPGRLSH